MTGFDLAAALAIGYLLGGIPTAELAAKLRGTSIFHVGSGNMGAMNTARNLGLALGLGVLAVDIGKGALAATLGLAMAQALGSPAGAAVAFASSAGVAAVVGHAWSPYVGLRGGKALATAFGTMLPLFPWAGLAALAMIVGLLLIFRRQEPATYLTLLAFPLLAYLATMRAEADQAQAFAATTAALGASLVVALKHLQLWLAARSRRRRPDR